MLEYRRPGSGRADFGSAGAGLRSQGLRWRGLRAWATSALIEVALLPFAPWITVVGDTTPNGLRSAMGFPTTKGAPHFVALHGVARMRHKENAAPPTTSPAASQVRLGAQNRSQNKIVFQHQGRYRALTIPVRPKFKMFRNRYCKKQKLRLRMLMLDLMPPVLPNRRASVEPVGRGSCWDGGPCQPCPNPAIPFHPTTWKKENPAPDQGAGVLNLSQQNLVNLAQRHSYRTLMRVTGGERARKA